jgi:hypothetical protein
LSAKGSRIGRRTRRSTRTRASSHHEPADGQCQKGPGSNRTVVSIGMAET